MDGFVLNKKPPASMHSVLKHLRRQSTLPSQQPHPPPPPPPPHPNHLLQSVPDQPIAGAAQEQPTSRGIPLISVTPHAPSRNSTDNTQPTSTEACGLSDSMMAKRAVIESVLSRNLARKSPHSPPRKETKGKKNRRRSEKSNGSSLAGSSNHGTVVTNWRSSSRTKSVGRSGKNEAKRQAVTEISTKRGASGGRSKKRSATVASSSSFSRSKSPQCSNAAPVSSALSSVTGSGTRARSSSSASVSSAVFPTSRRLAQKGMGSAHQHLIQLHQQAMLEHVQTNHGKKKRKSKRKRRHGTRNILAGLPDELLLYVFHYIPLERLSRDIALVSRRFAVLWVQGVTNVCVEGKLRTLTEDELIRVVRRFVRLESLDLCNSGSSEDYQLSDKGLLQLAHKYIYSSADYLSLTTPKDPLTGEFDFNFDFDSYLESLDAMTDYSEAEADLDSALEDDLSYGSQSFTTTNNNNNGNVSSVTLDGSVHQIAADDEGSTIDEPSTDASTSTTLISDNPYRRETLMFTTSHSHYFYPPPRYSKSGANNANSPFMIHQRSDSGDPSYGLHTLRSLNLLGCSHITENGVKYLNYICQNIQVLCLKGCTKVNDQALAYIAEFSQLENLDLTGCTHITDTGMHNLSKLKSNHLHTLDMTFCHQITDEGIRAMGRITSLTDLNLQCCGKITHDGVAALLNSNLSLRALNLTGCSLVELCHIDDEGNFPALEILNLMGCKLSCDQCMVTLSQWTNELRELVLAYSDAITDHGVETIVKCSPKLTNLNLKRCNLITTEAIQSISEHIGDKLEVLNLTTCRDITDQCLAVMPSFRNLKCLYLRKCYKITEIGLRHLTACHTLEVLDISEPAGATNEIIRNLSQALCTAHDARTSPINKLIIKRCTGLSQDLLEELTIHFGNRIEL